MFRRTAIGACLVVAAGSGVADAQAPPACPPVAFAKGQCDTIEAARTPAPPTGKLLIAPGPLMTRTLGDSTSAQAAGLSHIDAPAGSQAEDWSKWRSQDTATPGVGGVPSIRPLGRPAVVVSILSF